MINNLCYAITIAVIFIPVLFCTIDITPPGLAVIADCTALAHSLAFPVTVNKKLLPILL